MSNQMALQASGSERDDNLSSSGEDETICETEGRQNLESECLDSFINPRSERNESEFEKRQGQVLPDEIVASYPMFLPEKLLTNKVICDVLSS